MTGTMRRLSAAIGAPLALLTAFAVAPAAALGCTCPSRTDNQCIDLAKTGVGSPYWYGHAAWSTQDRNWKGADCSGFVVKAWQVPRTSNVWEDYHPYGTVHLFGSAYHWYSVSRASAWKGDAVGYPDPSPDPNTYGHVVLFYYGDPYGSAMVLEAPGTGYRIRQAWRNISSSKWRFRRRHNLTLTAGPA